MATPQDSLAAALAERYVIEREIGAGGMATVYLAQDVRHRRKVALKVLRPEISAPIGAERFLKEIEITANLVHPNILPLFDSGTVDGTVFYVMPFVEGETLRARLEREKQLPLADAVRIAAAVASALEHAHRHGVVHRDIKPENILLSGTHTLVADFGIGKTMNVADGMRLTGTGMVVGTPAYMSPEQASGETTLDGRSDLYGLGVVLFEMLSGTVPFSGSNPMAILARRFTESAPSIRTLRAAVPEALDRAVARALAREPVDRFATVAEFAEALQAGSAVTTAAAPVGPPRASIAVLPFANLSADSENAFFADGITEDVIAQLSKIRAVKVISSRSVMAFKGRAQSLREIGATLNVATVMEGSVRRAGNRVRIVAQLIEAESEQNLWAETYDRDLNDIFAIQAEVALRIATALQAELSTEERNRLVKKPTRDLEAYQFYLLGRQSFFQFTKEGIRRGIEYLEKAIQRDPGYAMAYAGLALAYVEVAVGQGVVALRSEEALRRARDAAAKALEIDPELGAAHCIAAYLKFSCDFDWIGAERDFKRAIELDPGGSDTYDLYGVMLYALERHDEALVMLRHARELDPIAHRTDIVTGLLRAGQPVEALQMAISVVEFDPNYPRAHSALGWAYLMNGRQEEGLASLEHAVSLAPGDTLWLAQFGQALGMAGKTEQARDVVRQLEEMSRERYVSPYHMAYPFVGLGDLERAMDLLEQAYQERAGAIYGIKGSFLFTTLRSHPRFIALCRRMNLA